MRTGVQQIFPLEIDFCTSQMSCQAFGKVERGGSPHKLLEVITEFLLKGRIHLGREILLLKLLEGVHECFWNIATSERAKMALSVGLIPIQTVHLMSGRFHVWRPIVS